jgi:XTP/dITP diphosphohydrolase
VRRVVFATTNRGKLAELQALVKGLPLEIVSPAEVGEMEVDEDQPTLEGNARAKAEAWARAKGMAALADDTGLCVDALGGAPGVRSARFAGEDFPDARARYRANNARLLRELQGVPLERRGAEFRCALCLSVPGRPAVVETGVCRGRIAFAARGTEGFGYDPLFELPELAKTFAELTPEEKNRISHRAKAFAAMRRHLEALAT